jgi:hypothetical protein
MAIFPPANSGTSPLSGIYASLRQAQIIILEILNGWMPVPLYLSGGVIIFAFLDLGKNISFSDSPLGFDRAFSEKGDSLGQGLKESPANPCAAYFFLSFRAASAISGRRMDFQSGSEPLILPFLLNVCQFSLRSSISIGFMGIV